MTPEEHQREFVYQAGRLGIEVLGRSMEDVAKEVINAPVGAIRDLEYCGAPCSPSELIAEADWATMRHARRTRPNVWLKSQILCSSTYDGSISHLVAQGQERTQLAKVFAAICYKRLKNAKSLLDIYQIKVDDEDDVVLEKICQVVTDIGYYGAALSGLFGAAETPETRTFHVLFDIGNPFTKLLESGRFATHTWDVVSLLGAYDDLLPEDFKQGVLSWRRVILEYCHSGEFPCNAWRSDAPSTLVSHKTGVKCVDQEDLTLSKPERLLRFAEQEGGEYGFDLLWEDVIRFFLKTGNPRYAHEALEIIQQCDQDHCE
ncbi:MAG: hypothetical protein Q9166_002112 [cf. Caloplaca sp. 2 TL-2023]